MTRPTPRPRGDRRRDTEHRLERDVDLWVATGSSDGGAHLVPLSFEWDGRTLLLATTVTSPTGRNLRLTQIVRLELGHPRDVTMVDGDVEVLELDALPTDRALRFIRRTGFDPRASGASYRWFVVTPRRVQAWREEDELSGRDLMRDGRWLA